MISSRAWRRSIAHACEAVVEQWLLASDDDDDDDETMGGSVFVVVRWYSMELLLLLLLLFLPKDRVGLTTVLRCPCLNIVVRDTDVVLSLFTNS